ncbi:Protein N-acetyltransferase, RimJ/RimL family [Micromonospora pattaloongensis]|uniref:Protein N-acetyltransferase, RimJ/RimL family n=1 Tax=Micromonospora pattaloongensis TaxID=405436 RepID=A0A1H3M3Q7_9ACTN|nr:GNAT family N-acetyltransferase [Micromonospora pattaloongensis]SDY70859.1 Protein N-acetyltransferase, RimJ/RimL family [Micromonospora pattaloongensis]
MEPWEIRADGLLLRPWRPDDAPAMHRACVDPEIGRWSGLPSPHLPRHAVDFIARARRRLAEGTAYHLGVFDAETGELLGSCALNGVDPAGGEARIGYWTAPWARGRRIAERSSRLLAGWGFDTLGLARIGWRAQIGNHVSRLVALRLGVRIEGVRRAELRHRDGRRADAWVGSLLRGELADPPETAGPGSVVARRAAVFAAEQPVLFAGTPHGEIRLRAPEDRDVDGVVTACRDPETLRWTTVPEPYERRHAEFFVGAHTRGRWARGDGAVFAVADAADRYVGSMELRISAADPAVADVGYMVAPAARGRGYAPAALAALTAWGFTSLGLARIEWHANVGNTASRRVAEKAGFVVEGTARAGVPHRGERVDAWVGALVARDVTAAAPGSSGAVGPGPA